MHGFYVLILKFKGHYFKNEETFPTEGIDTNICMHPFQKMLWSKGKKGTKLLQIRESRNRTDFLLKLRL